MQYNNKMESFTQILILKNRFAFFFPHHSLMQELPPLFPHNTFMFYTLERVCRDIKKSFRERGYYNKRIFRKKDKHGFL